MKYIVQDYAGGKYFTVGVYDTREEAEERRARFGYKARILPSKRRPS